MPNNPSPSNAHSHENPCPRYLKFENADWQLDGSTEHGLYPVETLMRTWHLDKGRPKPVLSVKRWQLPLVPAFAITAHSSQGKTLPLGSPYRDKKGYTKALQSRNYTFRRACLRPGKP